MKIGIIGTGKIVHEALFALQPVKDFELSAIFARPHSREKGEALAAEHHIPQVYTDYGELLEKSGVEAVYIGLANSAHFAYAKEALLAGVNVILEKPFTSTVAEAEELAAIAREKNLFCLEAITPLHSSSFQKLQAVLPRLGQIKLAQFNYSQYSSRYDKYLAGEVAPAFDPAASGGALYDINLYNIYISIGLFGEPEDVRYFPNLGFNGIDTSGIAVLSYPGFQVCCLGAKDSDSPCQVLIQGEKGYLRQLGKPNVPEGAEWEVVDEAKGVAPNAAGGMSRAMEKGAFEAEPQHHRMTQEFCDFAAIIGQHDRKRGEECLAWSLAVMRTLEKARKGAGIVFAADKI